jgi:hypothetical protein
LPRNHGWQPQTMVGNHKPWLATTKQTMVGNHKPWLATTNHGCPHGGPWWPTDVWFVGNDGPPHAHGCHIRMYVLHMFDRGRRGLFDAMQMLGKSNNPRLPRSNICLTYVVHTYVVRAYAREMAVWYVHMLGKWRCGTCICSGNGGVVRAYAREMAVWYMHMLGKWRCGTCICSGNGGVVRAYAREMVVWYVHMLGKWRHISESHRSRGKGAFRCASDMHGSC